MNYLLVKPEELDEQGYAYQYAERIPDGRVILPLGALKVLSNFSPEILSDDKLKTLIKEQKESGLYDSPEEENTSGSEEPENGENINGGEPSGEDTTTEEPTPTEDPVEQEGGDV
ncbi:hypothetical protein [uncultured Bacteroides sp.]|uniref:hypothetical protein n=1 Tax=uncultured Bacteroides sp. TaxID=162156 RepID=UPI0026128FD2|nr:hypothetical protein [uncultured Bacteroides sp.]